MAAYDLCVVGAGMIGSAAARHASMMSNNYKVCLIGPQEPKNRKLMSGNEVFGTHYDEGRMVRTSDTRPSWALFAKRSVETYRKLEQMSGIKFYHEVGSLTVGSEDGSLLSHTKLTGPANTAHPSEFEHLDNKQMKDRFPYMNFSQDDVGIFEGRCAGYINPRKMVMAQIIAACINGCDVIRDVTLRIENIGNVHRLTTESGRIILAKKILLATNVFTGLHKLLEKDVDFKAMPQTVTLASVTNETAHKLRDMPVVLYSGKGGRSWYKEYPRNPDGNIHINLLPPILYPDGKYYMKIGHSDGILKSDLSIKNIRKWYCGQGDEKLENQLFHLLETIFKDIQFTDHHGDACVTMVTPTAHPYLDLVTPTLGVALGGNGWAAKSSDEIGRIASEMIINSKWTYDLPRNNFQIRYKINSKL